MQAVDDRDQCLLELAQEADRVAVTVGDPAICTRLHEIAHELQGWTYHGVDRIPSAGRSPVRTKP
jgi:hypothetical protein